MRFLDVRREYGAGAFAGAAFSWLHAARRGVSALHERLLPRAFSGVVAGAVMDLEGASGGRVGEIHLEPAEIGVGKALRWIVGEEVLGAKFVADFAEGLVELRKGSGVVVFAAGIFRDLDEGMLTTGVASGA